MAINIKDAPFGAIGDGATDDTNAIQSAINYAKSLATPSGGAYKASVYFPPGSYYITQPINITNSNGIWLKGDGGSYLNTIILGNTSTTFIGRPMFDFSGSSVSGCENFTFLSLAGYPNRSTIGVQFALTGPGGTNCRINNCYFQMQDFPTANNSIGTVGILNVQSEEFSISDCLIRANAPIILSYQTDLSQLIGSSYIVTSAYQTLVPVGSMGVVSIRATSLQVYEKRQPALLLNGTNSVYFQGYIGRSITLSGTDGGSNETAIYCNAYTANLSVHTTIESFSRVLKVTNAGFVNSELNAVVSSQTAPSTELIDLTGCTVRGLRVRINGPAGQPNRYIIYHAQLGGGYQGVPASLTNCEITCFDVPNQYIISANLLRKCDNVVFNTNEPFEKRGGKIRQLYFNRVSAGTASAVTPATVFKFQQANLLPFNNTNAGYYRIWIDGVISAGGYGYTYSVTMSFQVQITVNQQLNGIIDPASITVIILDKSGANPVALDILGLTASISFSSTIATVTLTPRVSGTATVEPVFYNGQAEILSDFGVNDPIPLK